MNPYWLIVAFTVLTQFGIFLRWLHRRMRDAELERAFVRDIARIHLPHLYHGLQLIASRLGIELEDQPPVRFADFYDSDQQRRDESAQNHGWNDRWPLHWIADSNESHECRIGRIDAERKPISATT